MGQNLNIGQQQALVVYGNPESFKKLIASHGQLCKVKQAIACPCVPQNHGSPDMHCTICTGNGYTYTYQRRFLIADENCRRNDSVTELYPFFIPVSEVTRVERMISSAQGGIVDLPILNFNETTIFVNNATVKAAKYEQLRTTYFYDGWTKVTADILDVDVDNGLMWPTQTFYNAKYQSSNPLRAEADIVEIERIWNDVTGVEIEDYDMIGNTFRVKNEEIIAGQMRATYYYSDLTSVITADLKVKDDVETWTHDMESGNIRMAFFPWWNLSKGDIVVIAADANFRTELVTYTGTELTQLWEIELFELNDVILDANGNKYYRDEDFILVGRRYIKWISENRPDPNIVISVRYGFKPAFICYEDNPEPNNLENRRYPKIIYAKSWTKTSRDDVMKLLVPNGIPNTF